MKNKLQQYEEEQLKRVEETLGEETYEEAYRMSEKNLENKVEKTMRKAEDAARRKRLFTAGKIAVAGVAAAFVVTVSVPEIKAAATDFLHSTLGLTISGTDRDETAEAGFSYEWILKMTEKEYWEWLQAHELTGKEVPSYAPEDFQENREDEFRYMYDYFYVEDKEMDWSDKTLDPKDESTYGHLGTERTESLLSDAEKEKNALETSVLTGLSRHWKNGEKELYYRKEVYDIFQLEGQEKKRDKAAQTLTINGDEAYLVEEQSGTWLYIFGDDTITMLNANEAVSQGEAKELLVKMAESIG